MWISDLICIPHGIRGCTICRRALREQQLVSDERAYRTVMAGGQRRLEIGAGSGETFVPQCNCMQPIGHWLIAGGVMIPQHGGRPGVLRRTIVRWLAGARWVAYPPRPW